MSDAAAVCKDFVSAVYLAVGLPPPEGFRRREDYAAVRVHDDPEGRWYSRDDLPGWGFMSAVQAAEAGQYADLPTPRAKVYSPNVTPPPVRVPPAEVPTHRAEPTQPQQPNPDPYVAARFAEPLPTHEELVSQSKNARDLNSSANRVTRHTLPQGRFVYQKNYRSVNSPEPYTEEAVSKAMRRLGFTNVPPSRVNRDANSRPYVVTAHAPGKELVDVMEDGTPEERERVRKVNPESHVGRWLTASWLLNMADRHEKNHLVGADGQIYPIDAGMALHPEKDRGDAWSWNHDALLGYGLAKPTTPLDPEFVGHLLKHRPHVEAAVNESLPGELPEGHDDSGHYGRWREAALENLKNRFGQLEGVAARLKNGERLTLADLPTDRTPRLPYNQIGERTKNLRGHGVGRALWIHGE